ncbi:hypothetical protein C8R47DRAFT_1128622 [Mycena vitilis]|nr:hypothetical protein C8R47DRAFT_1128622 [Mycena vitilis]
MTPFSLLFYIPGCPLAFLYLCFTSPHLLMPRNTAFSAFVTYTCDVEEQPSLGPRLNDQLFYQFLHGPSSTKPSTHLPFFLYLFFCTRTNSYHDSQ